MSIIEIDNPAYVRGREDRRLGAGRTENPYHGDPDSYQAWLDGWTDEDIEREST